VKEGKKADCRCSNREGKKKPGPVVAGQGKKVPPVEKKNLGASFCGHSRHKGPARIKKNRFRNEKKRDRGVVQKKKGGDQKK